MSTEPLSSLIPRELTELHHRPLMDFQIAVNPPSIIGATPGYDRRIGEIAGGRFEGERLRGKILRDAMFAQAGGRDGVLRRPVVAARRSYPQFKSRADFFHR